MSRALAEVAHEEAAMTVPTASSTSAMVKGQADAQVETAKRFPRSVAKSLTNALSLATVNPEVAAACKYRKPQGGGKFVEGPSVRLAEIMASTWGNLRCEARVVEVTDSEVVAYGMAWDLETNTAFASEVRASILKSDGARYQPTMIATVANAACSKALRNAIFRVVPRAAVQEILNKTVEVACGDAKTLADRRSGALKWFAAKKVTQAQIFAHLSDQTGRRVAGVEDVTLEDLEILNGVRQAIADEETTVEDVFGAKGNGSKSVIDALPQQEPSKPLGKGDERATPPPRTAADDGLNFEA